VNVLSFSKGSAEKLSDHFVASEFDCPCGVCSVTFIEPALVEKLELLRAKLGCPIDIDRGGGYRCDFHQRELSERGIETAKGRSQHQDGRAADISTGDHSGMELERAARAVGFRAVGVAKRWIHVDLRDDRDRHWGYRS
jgi:uncharacterized protein YcbK (DUF882 family)